MKKQTQILLSLTVLLALLAVSCRLLSPTSEPVSSLDERVAQTVAALEAPEIPVAPTSTETPDDTPEDLQLVFEILLDLELLTSCPWLDEDIWLFAPLFDPQLGSMIQGEFHAVIPIEDLDDSGTFTGRGKLVYMAGTFDLFYAVGGIECETSPEFQDGEIDVRFTMGEDFQVHELVVSFPVIPSEAWSYACEEPFTLPGVWEDEPFLWADTWHHTHQDVCTDGNCLIQGPWQPVIEQESIISRTAYVLEALSEFEEMLYKAEVMVELQTQ
jgi:hypothetical protein